MKSRSRGFFVPSVLEQPRCKFKHDCGFFSDSSYTCTHGGGVYCGRYRGMCKKLEADVEVGVLLQMEQGVVCVNPVPSR